MSLIDRIEKLANVRGIAVLLLLIFLGVFVARNFDFLADVTFHIARPGGRPAVPDTTSSEPRAQGGSDHLLKFSQIDVCRVDFSLPCYLMVQVTNTGRYDKASPTVVVDFGRARFEQFEIRPSIDVVAEQDSGRHVIRFTRSNLEPHQSVYLYALTSGPNVESVSLYAGGQLRDQKTADDLASFDRKGGGRVPAAFIDFLWILAALGLIVLFVWVLVTVIKRLNRWVGSQPST